MADQRTEIPQAVQAMPSVTAIILWLSGKDVSWWAGVIGIGFLLTQWAYLVWRWRREARRAAKDSAAMPLQG